VKFFAAPKQSLGLYNTVLGNVTGKRMATFLIKRNCLYIGRRLVCRRSCLFGNLPGKEKNKAFFCVKRFAVYLPYNGGSKPPPYRNLLLKFVAEHLGVTLPATDL